MSIKAMSHAWQEEILPTQKLVFLAICDNANDEGLCYPSILTIVKKTGLSNKTIIKILNELVELKLIQKHQRAKKNGGRYSTLYLVFPLINYDNLDNEYKEKFSQSEVVTPYSQSEVVTPQNGIQSEVVTPKPSLYNHHLFKELSHSERELYLEYIALRKTLNLKTTIQIHERLLKKYFEFGRNTEVITKAINSNWRDFYNINAINTKQPKQQDISTMPLDQIKDLDERMAEAERRRQANIEKWEAENGF